MLFYHFSQNYSVMLVIPDFYDRVYVRELVNILLVSLGFKQICVQQVSCDCSSTPPLSES